MVAHIIVLLTYFMHESLYGMSVCRVIPSLHTAFSCHNYRYSFPQVVKKSWPRAINLRNQLQKSCSLWLVSLARLSKRTRVWLNHHLSLSYLTCQNFSGHGLPYQWVPEGDEDDEGWGYDEDGFLQGLVCTHNLLSQLQRKGGVDVCVYHIKEILTPRWRNLKSVYIKEKRKWRGGGRSADNYTRSVRACGERTNPCRNSPFACC